MVQVTWEKEEKGVTLSSTYVVTLDPKEKGEEGYALYVVNCKMVQDVTRLLWDEGYRPVRRVIETAL